MTGKKEKIFQESQRLCNLLPMNLTRIVGRDVEIGGKIVPAGTTLVPQISTVLYDENVRIKIIYN
jgi:cytochrome P450